MPSGMAAEMRAALPSMSRDGVELQRSDKSLTGFTNVIEVKGTSSRRACRCLAMVVVEQES